MDRTVLGAVVLVIIILAAVFIFYDGSTNEGDTTIDDAEQAIPAAPANAPRP
jgi:hypothetical protein